VETRQATKADCRTVAELALIAGEGIPAYFWEPSQQPGEALEDVGARHAASETDNFSFRNAHLAVIGTQVAGMLLAYRLPDEDGAESLDEFPLFIRPLIELERCVPGTFYINMLAAYPRYRNQGVGTALMALADGVAATAGCAMLSVEVFEKNAGALRFYRRLGYAIVDRRPVIPHPYQPHDGDILLLTKTAETSRRYQS
jgi:ribosomal protein S18 acetylase RimI-like enzyme